MTDSLSHPPRIDHFTVTKVLGTGGMGTVYHAFDERLHRDVAIKALKSERQFNPSAGRRFLREARLLSKLNHPNICQVYDLVEQDNQRFLVLELVEGTSLKEAAGRGLEQTRILEIIHQTALALATAHHEHIIHRDLKPENIMVTPDGQVKVLDFGIARLAETTETDSDPPPPNDVSSLMHADHRVTSSVDQTMAWTAGGEEDATSGPDDATLHTRHGTIVGTPGTMAPEQVLGITPTTACDIYSLGVILQTLLTGVSPYGEDLQTMDLLIKVSEADTIEPVGLDTDVGTLITEMTARAPEDRPPAEECARQLQWILDKPERRRRKRILTTLSSIAALAVLVAGGVALTHRWQAERQARLAQEFAEMASTIEWTLRAEHLAPPHDLRPAKLKIRNLIDDLENRVSDVGGAAAAPGHAAIGQALAGLGDFHQAQVSLEAAYDLGMRSPELSCALGLNLGTLYERALSEASRISDQGLQTAARRRAREDFRDPAIAHLTNCGESADIPAGYVDALIALHEERFEDCRESLDSVTEYPSWFYEVDALDGLLTFRQAKISGQSNLDDELAGLQAATLPIKRALEVGRSDPTLHLRLCEIQSDLIYNRVFGRHTKLPEEQFTEALANCRRVIEIDEDWPFAGARTVEILSLKGLEAQYRGLDPSEAYAVAQTAADQVVASFPDSYLSYWTRGSVALNRSWVAMYQGQDATPIIEQCVSDFRQALILHPAADHIGNSIGNCAYIGAVQSYWRGEDPGDWVTIGMEALEPLLGPGTKYIYPHTAAANISFLQGLWEENHGTDAQASFDTAIKSYRIVTTSDPSGVNIGNLANALVEKSRVQHDMGLDPTETLESAFVEIRRTIAADANLDMPHFLMGNAGRIEAERAILKGEDPSPIFQTAFKSFDTGLTINPRNMEGYTETAEARLAQARWLVDENRNPTPAIEECLSKAAETLKLNPAFSRAQRAIAEAHLLGARWEIARGRSPLPLLEAALGEIEKPITEKPDEADSYRILGAIHLARAQWLDSRGETCRADVEAGLDAINRSLEINSLPASARQIQSDLQALQ